MSSISDLYIRTQMTSALAEIFNATPRSGGMEELATRLISALDDRDIDLRPR